MKIHERVEVARPADEVARSLAHPERRPNGSAWSVVSAADGGYQAILRAHSGPVRLDFDCRFEVVAGDPLRVKAVGVSPRMGFTADASFAVRPSGGGSVVELDADVLVSGPLAGLGQRSLAEQARRLLLEFVAPAA